MVISETFSNSAGINYIWSSNAPPGLVASNPYTDRSVMMVVQSGKKDLNAWVDEERNIYEDYRKVFKAEPPMISGVAIMTEFLLIFFSIHHHFEKSRAILLAGNLDQISVTAIELRFNQDFCFR